MVLPLYLAMTVEEMERADQLPRYFGIFDPPGDLPPGAMMILTDRAHPNIPKPARPSCVLLDFEKPPEKESRMIAGALFQPLSCPVAAPPGFIEDSLSPAFLPPCPLQVPLEKYLSPWQGREVWLDMTMQQMTITVTRSGARYSPAVPADMTGGVFDEILLCQCVTDISEDKVRFTLFDTPDTLKRKLAEAARLGVTRAVGLYQELHGKL